MCRKWLQKYSQPLISLALCTGIDFFIAPMAVRLRMNNNSNKRGVLTRLKNLINTHAQLQRFYSPTPPNGTLQDQLSPKTDSDSSATKGRLEVSKWATFDASEFGITSSRISRPCRDVMKYLQRKGFKSYLVGGCVRDLILNRTPKDFDVVTTAELTEVQMLFRKLGHAIIKGQRYPVCLVRVKRAKRYKVEITSFETEGHSSKESDQFRQTLLPKFNNKHDLIRWKDSMRKDFTINSLFYEPFTCKIYDYANGLADLRSLKLETVIPAQLSFKEDPGRILRGIRIAARLGLSLSREIVAAILTYSSLVKKFDKNKIMIELNYMLSYGAAEPSLCLLWKYNLLEFLLPVHAAYLDEKSNKEDGVASKSNMLMVMLVLLCKTWIGIFYPIRSGRKMRRQKMTIYHDFIVEKLFLHLDNLVACDRPSDCTLWIGLLSFHLALVNNPQDTLVVLALASVLYHGGWDEGVRFAKERAEMCVNFAPEIRRSSLCKSDEKIAKAVTNLASLVMESVTVLVENNSLHQFKCRYPSSPCSGMVFISGKTGKLVSEIFEVLVDDVQSYRSKRSSKINYDLLGKGNLSETRYVLGKIVLDTMTSGIVEDGKDFEAEMCHCKTEDTKETDQLQLSDPVNHQSVASKHKRQVSLPPNPERKQEQIKKQKLVAREECPERIKLSQKRDPSRTKDSAPKMKNYQRKQLMKDRRKTTTVSTSSSAQARQSKKVEHSTHTPSQSKVSKNSQKVAGNSYNNVDAKTTNKSDFKKGKSQLSSDEVVKDEERKQQHKNKLTHRPLSGFFK